MKKYIEGIVESIEKRGISKNIELKLSDKNRLKNIVFFEELVSVKDKSGFEHQIIFEDEDMVSVGDEVCLFHDDKNVAVKIFKEKDKLEEQIDTSIKNKQNGKKIMGKIETSIMISIVISFFTAINYVLIFLGGALICHFSEGFYNFVKNEDAPVAFGMLGFSFLVSIIMAIFIDRKIRKIELKEKNRLKKMVSDFRENLVKQNIELRQDKKQKYIKNV